MALLLAEQSRLFFALWPDDDTRARAAALARRFQKDYGGREMARESLHITLVFLGQTLDSRIPGLEVIAGAIATPSFTLALTYAGGWPGGIFRLAPRQPPEELAVLVKTLRLALKSDGFFFDGKPFVPHMTLLRKARTQPAEIGITPVEFFVRDFVLVRTQPEENGVRHEVIGRFPLSAG